jgi:uncharacterized protein
MNFNSEVSNTRTRGLLSRIYAFMAIALCITACVAFYVFRQPAIMELLLTNRWVVLGFFLAQLALVIVLSVAISRLSYPVALFIFFLYSALMGITFSTILLVYTQSSIYTAFFVTSGMFAALALYGYATKADLTAVGNYTLMGLFGLIIGFIVNLFLGNSLLDYILTIAGVIIFSVLTAYDVQKLKRLSEALHENDEMENKIAVVGALTLYLDFINLFLMLLRLVGRRNNK